MILQAAAVRRGSFCKKGKVLLDRMYLQCYNITRGEESTRDSHGPLAQLVRASGS